MILAISNDKIFTEKLGYVILTPTNFNDLAYHPYVQSQEWEAIIVDVDETINRSYITQILKSKGNIVIPRLLGDLNPKTLLLMFEIYPGSQAELMSAFKSNNRTELENIVNKLKVAYKWEIYY